MRVLVLLIAAGIIIGLLYLNSTHEGGIGGVWDDLTSSEAPDIQIEYQPISP